jgi:hypothetical protein
MDGGIYKEKEITTILYFILIFFDAPGLMFKKLNFNKKSIL